MERKVPPPPPPLTTPRPPRPPRPPRREASSRSRKQRRVASSDVPSDRGQSQRNVRRRAVGAAFTASASGIGERVRGGRELEPGSDAPIPRIATLGELELRLALAFLPLVPDRLRAEAVCRPWRLVSQRDVAVDALDFDGVKPPRLQDLTRLLERANGALTRLVLPDVRVGDVHVEILQRQSNLRSLRAYRLQKKHLFSILESCTRLETLELLDCAELQLAGWKRSFAPSLSEIWLRRSLFLTSHALKAVLQATGPALKKLYLTGASNADSQVLRSLTRYADGLEELAFTHCRTVSHADLEVFMRARASTLRWLDLSSCPTVYSFPSLLALPMLQVLILDKTRICDEGLQAIASAASNLHYLSLQDCRALTDAGLQAIASSCVHLELLDLKGTRVADESLQALERACPNLRMVRLDSCRSVSRAARQKYDEMARTRTRRGRLDELEQHFMDRQRVDVVHEASSSDGESSSESSGDVYSY